MVPALGLVEPLSVSAFGTRFPPSPVPVQYQMCHKVFNTSEGFTKHRLRHGNSNEMPYECKMCQKAFNPSECLEKHQLIHGDSNKMSYDCDLCPKVCKSYLISTGIT